MKILILRQMLEIKCKEFEIKMVFGFLIYLILNRT